MERSGRGLPGGLAGALGAEPGPEIEDTPPQVAEQEGRFKLLLGRTPPLGAETVLIAIRGKSIP
jgi:hypothetical protein